MKSSSNKYVDIEWCSLAAKSWGRKLVFGIMLLGGAGFAALLGCGGGGTSLPSDWGNLDVQQNTPENFQLAWDVFDQILVCKLLRTRDAKEDETNSNELIDDPVFHGESPKDLIYAPSISLQHARNRVINCLNNWIGDGVPQDDRTWQRDALIDRLPAYLHDNQLEKIFGLQSLDVLQYPEEDFDYLQQCVWMRDISSRWALDSEPGPLTRKSIRDIETSLDGNDAQQLVTAMKLFDWTTRNIQLDELLPAAKDITAGPGGDQRPVSAAQRGLPGPGYTAHPWQVLLFGHGDAWQRARVFIQLARQQNIDAVMLAAEDTGPAAKHRPLFVGVRVGDKLYLFDSALGLPIPGPEGRPVATLDEVQADPALLRGLDYENTTRGETLQYPVAADDVKSIVALIDADPPALSRRMRLAEDKTSGEDKITLTVSPVAIASRLQKCPGVKSVRLWTIPFDTAVYRYALPFLARNRPDVAAILAFEQQIFGDVVSSPPCMGRYCHLHGRFRTVKDDPSAAKWYLDARAPKEYIDGLDRTAELQAGSTEEEITDEQREFRKQSYLAAAQRLRTVKWQTTVWLAQTLYERREIPSAINWLKKVKLTDDNPWRGLASYNLARAHEVMGDIDAARLLYLSDATPQKHGVRLRARQLLDMQKSGKQASSAAASPES